MFEIFKSENNDQFYFRLKAKNGQIVLSSQGYSSKSAAQNGVESVKKNSTEDAQYERKEAANGKFFFNLLAANKQIIGSSQMYANTASMETGIQSVKNNAPGAEVVDTTIA
ncbi:MAG TPA: YegP family protein [Saprospiraceae bacterium]|nr:YegP family protein [Saprospiraceae bacterium]HMQ82388.1 YegP family protein [Saprospiraceae bacterium]